MKKEILNLEDEEIVSTVKMGGYYRWNWKFPFRHFVEEEVLIATRKKIFKLENL